MHKKIDLYLLSDLDFYISDNPNILDDDFWDVDLGFLKQRRHMLIRSCRHVFTQRFKRRYLITYLWVYRSGLFSLKNKTRSSIFRKYVNTNQIFNRVSASPLRADNLMMRKVVFDDFLSSNGYYYSWCNMFSKMVFMHKQKCYKQPTLSLRKGCDLFILGDIDNFAETEETINSVFMYRYYNFLLENNKENQPLNFNLFFDINVNITLEFYKIIQLIFLNICSVKILNNLNLFLKKYGSSSNGLRHKVKISSVSIESKKRRYFNIGYKNSAGRNKTGRITLRGRLGGNSNYLMVDFSRRYTNKLGVVLNNVRNNNRNSLMALVKYSSGGYSYILSTLGLINGCLTQSIWRPERFSMKYFVGCAVFLKHIINNSIFFNLELREGVGATISRSAGTHCYLIKTDHDINVSLVKIPSGKLMKVSSYCLVVLGKNHNRKFYKTTIGKCGSNIHKGFKSKVRGIAMNPVDHPHGGRTKTNSPERSLWGKIAKLGK